LANVDAPLSTAAFNSQGLSQGILSETGATVSPAQAGKNSYASTGAAQVGLGTDPTQFKNQNQLILSKLLEASAPPSTDVKDQLVEIPGNPLLYAKAAYERSAANWSTTACPLGQPIAYGENALAKAEVLNTNTAAGAPALGADGSQPLVSVNTGSDPRSTNFSKSYNYLFPNGDGTFGVGSVTHMTIAPVTLFKGTANELTIEVSGPLTLRAEASGKPGGSKVDYLPDTNGNAPVVTVHMGGKLMGTLGLNDILGKTGLPPIDIGQNGQNLLEIRVANPAHAIGNEKAGPTTTTNEASAASDIIRVTLLNIPNTIKGAELRLGHMEAKAVVPTGGVECTIPVNKTADPVSVTAPGPFKWVISIPTSIDAFKDIDCDLTNITAKDTATVSSGSPIAKITDASGAASNKTGTVGPSKDQTFTTTWTGLSYKKGDPPLQFTISGNIPANSGAGVLQNTVSITAQLTNCKGGAAGQDLIGNATVNGRATTLNNGAVVGAFTVQGPNVAKAANVLAAKTELATTGQKDPWLPVLGGGLLLGALALMRSRRRLAEVHSETR